MGSAWEYLGQALKAARAARGITQAAMAAELGVSRATVQKIERGEELTKPSPTQRAFARKVGWTEDSIDAVLAGGEPSITPDDRGERELKRPAAITQEGTGLPLRVVDELEDDGKLIDSVVLPLGDDARMVVVVKGKPGASPEQIRRNLLAWRRAQRHLQSVDDEQSATDVANEA